MNGAWRWMAVLALVIVGLFLVSSASVAVASAAKPNVTYSVQFSEVGLITGTTWYVTFNGGAYSSSGVNLTITGVSAANYYWYLTSAPVTAGAQYVGTPSSGYVNVNYQLHQFVVFQKQDLVSFTVLPSGSPTAGSTSPGTGYYTVGSKLPITAIPNPGFTFSKWTSTSVSLAFANALSASTVLTIGATGTITAHFVVVKTKVTFTEQGLSPTGLALGWTVTLNSAPVVSNTATLVTGAQGVGNYYWSISPVSVGSGDQFAPYPASGYVQMPNTATINVEFIEQFQVTFSVGSGTGTGSISPSGTQWYNTGSEVALSAYANSGSLFQKWAAPAALSIGSTTLSATNITVAGTGTVTATFKTGTQCNPSGTPSTCTLTFVEWGLPANSTWSVSYNSVIYTGSTSTITVTHVSASGYAYPANPVGTGTVNTGYFPDASYKYVSLPYQVSMLFVYTKEYYVTMQTTGGYSSSSILYYGTGWYPQKLVLPLNTQPNAYTKFTKWTTTGAGLTLSTATKPSTYLTIGAAGTITATFSSPSNKIEFMQTGLPAGTGWGVTVNGLTYYSSGWDLNVSAVPSNPSDSWIAANTISSGTAGVAYQTAQSGTYYMPVPYQLVQAIVYYQVVQVTITQTGGGTTNPSGTFWYANGTTIALAGTNGTSVVFKSWSAAPAANVAFVLTNKPATTATVSGPATITAKFA